MTKKLVIFFITIILLLTFLISYKFCFLRIQISNDYYIQQKPFTSNYIFFSKKYGKIIEHIYEWKETDNFIYGSCYNDKDLYFLYKKKNNEIKIFEDLHSFYNKLDSLNLVYTMDNCTRVMDFKRVY